MLTTLGTAYWPGRAFPGFFVMGNAVIPAAGLYSWTGFEAGVPFHARVLGADERAIRTSGDLYLYVGALPVGTAVRYTLAKGDSTLLRTVPTMRFRSRDYCLTVGFLVILGLVVSGSGIIVSILQPHAAGSRAFLLTGFFTGLFALTGTALYHPDLWWLSRVHFLAQAFFPAAFIHLGLTFPAERPFVTRRPVWIALPYVIAALLTAWVFAGFYASPPRTTSLYATYLYGVLSILVLVGLVAVAYWENRAPRVRPQLRVVFPGLVLATGIGLFGFLNTARFGSEFRIDLIAITPLLFYLSVGYAIAKHDLFDIDGLVRQAVVYGALTLAITGAYAGSLVILGWLLPMQVARAYPVFNMAFVVLVAFVFAPLRARVRHVIDRTFYRAEVDYRRTVADVSSDLTLLLDLGQVFDRVGRTITEGFQIRSLAFMLWREEDCQVWRYNQDWGHVEPPFPVRCGGLRRCLDLEPRGLLTIQGIEEQAGKAAASDAAAVRREMEALGAALLVPLTVAVRPLGAFAIGPRLSGRRFNREDIELLTTLAAQCAVAVQNAQSYSALQELNEELDSKVRARTAELEASNVELGRAYRDLQKAQSQLVQTEKMASLGQLVAGVAHEINNPVSFIVSNVAPLRRRVAALKEAAEGRGDVDLVTAVDRISEVLGVIGRGAERTAGIVRDLRIFSRLGEEQPRPVDLHEGIEVSLRLLRPRWAERITIHRVYAHLPAVEAAPSQINQVFLNVLANACDAISGAGNIWIHTACDYSRVTVTVRDDGGGIAREDLSRIFDPFFTTKPVGKGMGLGLAISHGIISQHGGTISAASEIGRGSEFTIILPLRQKKVHQG